MTIHVSFYNYSGKNCKIITHLCFFKIKLKNLFCFSGQSSRNSNLLLFVKLKHVLSNKNIFGHHNVPAVLRQSLRPLGSLWEELPGTG